MMQMARRCKYSSFLEANDFLTRHRTSPSTDLAYALQCALTACEFWIANSRCSDVKAHSAINLNWGAGLLDAIHILHKNNASELQGVLQKAIDTIRKVVAAGPLITVLAGSVLHRHSLLRACSELSMLLHGTQCSILWTADWGT